MPTVASPVLDQEGGDPLDHGAGLFWYRRDGERLSGLELERRRALQRSMDA